MWRPSIGICIVLAIVGSAAGAAPPEQYVIKLHRPEKVGSVYQIKKVGAVQSELTYASGQRKAAPRTGAYGVELTARGEVLEVDAKGAAMKMSFTVEKCIELTSEHVERELLAPGSVVIAESGSPGPTFTLTRGTLKEAQRQALSLIITPPARGSATADECMGTSQPQKLGASWPASAPALLQRCRQYGMKTTLEAISGSTTLSDVQTVEGRQYLSVKGQQKVSNFAPEPDARLEKLVPGLRAVKSSLVSTVEALLPLAAGDRYRRDTQTDTVLTTLEGQTRGQKVTMELKRTRVVHTEARPLAGAP